MLRLPILTALWLTAAPAQITYVDATKGPTGNTTLADGTPYTPSSLVPVVDDGWEERVFANGGAILSSNNLGAEDDLDGDGCERCGVVAVHDADHDDECRRRCAMGRHHPGRARAVAHERGAADGVPTLMPSPDREKHA
ncbi:MAG: hypothetical protein H6834_16340 [Planctomycetes bacterium]|nr:hypothetical protein [Planctomycetota bacterium]